MAKKSSRIHPSEFIDNLDDVKAFEDGMDDDLEDSMYCFFVNKAARSSIDFECPSDVALSDTEQVPLDMGYGMTHAVDDGFPLQFAEPSTPKVLELRKPDSGHDDRDVDGHEHGRAPCNGGGRGRERVSGVGRAALGALRRVYAPWWPGRGGGVLEGVWAVRGHVRPLQTPSAAKRRATASILSV